MIINKPLFAATAEQRFYAADMLTAMLTLEPISIYISKENDEFEGEYYNVAVELADPAPTVHNDLPSMYNAAHEGISNAAEPNFDYTGQFITAVEEAKKKIVLDLTGGNT